jgi:hypothetical protein
MSNGNTNGNGNGNGNGHGQKLAREGLTTAWLASRLGTQSARVEVMRRSGELLGVRVPGRPGHIYPAWQFGRDGKPLANLQMLIRTARAGGVGDEGLYRILDMKTGLTGSRRVVDELRDGNNAPALRAIAAARKAG